MNTIRIGSGAGCGSDRIEPAAELAAHGNIHYLVYECLAERTIAIAQQARQRDPAKGYDALLEARLRLALPLCRQNGVKIISNMGAANPQAAGAALVRLANELSIRGLKIAVISGDDVTGLLTRRGYDRLSQRGFSVSELGNRLFSANAYLGHQPIVEALAHGADIVLTGRVADPSLFLAPLVHEFCWADDDWPLLGQGTVIGHLLECGGQLTGGYFADPGRKDVAGLARLGFPLAEVSADGSAVFSKVTGSGGQLTLMTCKEQLLYEVHDPAAYITPDVVADFTNVQFTGIGPDQVRMHGGYGRARTDSLKVAIGYDDGFIGEGEIAFAGPGASGRARLAAQILAERFTLTGVSADEIRYDLIGINAMHGPASPVDAPEPYEVRLRVAARTPSRATANQIGDEVETLYTNGPAGGSGIRKLVRPILAMDATLIARELVQPVINYLET